MRTPRGRSSSAHRALAAALLGLVAAGASVEPDSSGVWGPTAAFLAKGAGLISQLDQSILRRVPDLSS